jgi:uncharacterized protein
MDDETNIKSVNPIQTQNRIEFLDVLRGIAILFIFLANIVIFSGYLYFDSGSRIPATTFFIDESLDFITFTLIDGKFYSIFSLLFGIGCVIQYTNLKKHNKPFAPFFRRRMFGLLVIGLIHLCLFWLGDILTLYALLGFVLIWFVDLSDKKLLTFATILIVFPIINWLFVYYTAFNYSDFFFRLSVSYYEYFDLPITEWNGQTFPDFQKWSTNASLSDYFKMNIGNSLIRIGGILNEGRVFKVFGIFLIGVWTGRQILNNALLNNVAFLKKITLIGISIGLPVSVIRTFIEFYAEQNNLWEFLNIFVYAFGTVPLAMGYAALLALIYRKRNRFLNVFAPVGKTALSNYIFQTFIAVTIFYGIGFGFTGKFGYTVIIGIALLVFIIQIILSTWWLQKFKFGPLEWLWRQLTYGKKLKIKK